MKLFDSYRLHITPLSPVHIGTGESYEPTNYVIEDGALHEFDTGAMDALSAKDREGLLNISNGKPDTRMLLAMQNYFFDRRNDLVPWAINRCPIASGVSKIYSERIGKAAQVETGGRIIVNELAIDRAGYNPITRKPVLFGSSLKGAMRTALLDWVNDRQPVREVEDRRTGRIRKENNQELQQRLFEFRAGKFELDPLRLVQLADAVWLGESDLPATQVSFAVNRYKKDARDKHGNALKPKTDKGPDQLLECVSGWRYRAFSAQLNLQRTDGVADADRKGQRQLPADELRFDVAQIADACNAFYWPILRTENETMRQRSYLDPAWDRATQKLLETARDKMDRGKAFLLRVGRHSGAESVTLNGVRHIKIMEGKDPQTHKQRFSFAAAAKTLWLAADEKDQRTGLLPFGWLLVEIQPLDAPEQDWPELQALCEPHLEPARAFAAKLNQQREKLEQARREAEQRRQKEEAETQEKAERAAQARREEEERKKRLDALSDNARNAENLKNDLTPSSKGRGKGHKLYQDVCKKIQEAASWTPEDRAILKEMAIQCFEHLGLKRDDYKKLLRGLDAP